MKFVFAFYGSRGDVEPCVAIGKELQRRGHEVCMAVSPNLIDFATSAGFSATAFGPDARIWQDLHRDFMTHLFRRFWRIRELIRLGREDREMLNQFWHEANSTLTALADGADLLFATSGFDQPLVNIGELYGIPLATLHTSPLRVNSELVPIRSSPTIRAATTFAQWLGERLERKFNDAQRRDLGLPPAKPRHGEGRRESLEIQAYDEACFPGLSAVIAKGSDLRPMVGALTVEMSTHVDEEVAAWAAAGTPPIFFGFGSMPVASPADTLAMIAGACAEIGERALVVSAGTDFGHADFDHVKLVESINFAKIFPACRAVVHHGGTGTTAAGLRAGIPTVILSTWLDQTLWGAQIKRLKIGTARSLSSTTRQSLVEDLRTVLAPDYAARARDFANRMTTPAESAANAALCVEKFARLQRVS
jgi:UDP:flavonoid glycosyltransferase YjiC (YdhE family)